jgi:hypothetical protein
MLGLLIGKRLRKKITKIKTDHLPLKDKLGTNGEYLIS